MALNDFLSCEIITGSLNPYYRSSCQGCPNKARVGDSIIIFDRGRNAYVGRELVVHVECFQKWLARKPLSKSIAEVNYAVEQLRTAGSKVFAELAS